MDTGQWDDQSDITNMSYNLSQIKTFARIVEAFFLSSATRIFMLNCGSIRCHMLNENFSKKIAHFSVSVFGSVRFRFAKNNRLTSLFGRKVTGVF